MRSLLTAAFIVMAATVSAQESLRPYLAIVVDYPTSIPTDAQWMQWERDAVSQVDGDNTDQSYGLAPQVSIVVGPFVIDPAPIIAAPDFESGATVIAQEAQAAAVANGIDLTPYLPGSNFIYLFPQPSAFGATWSIGGLGHAGGIWIGGAFGRTALPGRVTLTHEEGHHTGTFWEQEGLDCSDQSPIGGAKGVTCVSRSYQDSVDVMGEGSGQFNAIEKCRRGWLPCPAVVGYGDYLIAPLESGAGVRSIAVDIARQGFQGVLPLTLEYRQPIGMDANLSWVNPANVYHGVIGHLGWQPTQLLRLHPDDPTWSDQPFNAPALPVGETICFTRAHVSITTLSADAAGALVRVERCH